ncbi:MAG TPA: dTDP-4-dehydrorhamnose 3,5-epimerase family protein [Candidatus Acidoferrales bacterium]|nr:dTDP-4-dehydrorhamnose 3,5-epimerase family protein [Candidatus Acidoferrales bacterium]
MKIVSVISLEIPDVKVVRFARFVDSRGFFTEPYRRSDSISHPGLENFRNLEFVQVNESFSIKGVCRGLHFQWNPFMGKLVRTITGRMVDMVLDIRKGSPTLGKIIAYDMPTEETDAFNEWIWVPPGFAHGNFFPEDSRIEYLCSGEYSPGCEAGISPLAEDIDWSLCSPQLKSVFDNAIVRNGIFSEKDKNGLSLSNWLKDTRSDNFLYGSC